MIYIYKSDIIFSNRGKEAKPIKVWFLCLFLCEGEVIKIEDKYYKVWLSLIKNLGIKRYLCLIERFKSFKGIYNAKEYDLKEIAGIGGKISSQLLDENIRILAKRHLEYMIKNNIDIVSIYDIEYPNLLKEIYDPPINLYVRGDKKILSDFCLAIIGCREATEYGRKVAQEFSYKLSKENVIIVSGLARGIDAMAHWGTVYAKGKTVAVLGNGLDSVYPKENNHLAQMIIESGGAIISEYPLGTRPDKMNFVARNRIISGLSRGVVIVEAKEKSGTLLTVDFALEQGRDIFVVPGNIDSANSIGTNELIKQGGRIITDYRDVLGEY